MIQISVTTIVICAIIIVAAVITPMVNIFFRKVGNRQEVTDDSQLPCLSVLLTVQDNARELEQHLPAILTQDYPAGFEVIVVVSKGEDDTDDVLKKLSATYPNLYTTFIPDSPRYMSRKKLAVTLGVKAARHEWILMTEARFQPASDQWLKTMARHCQETTDMVIGYANYDQEASDYKRFECLQEQCYILRRANRSTAFRCEPGNLLFRKSLFLDNRGFEGNLKYVRGEYDFIVNKFAEKGNTVIETSPEAWVIEDAPTKKTWKNRHLYLMETKRHLKRSFCSLLPYRLDHLLMHLNYLLIIGCACYGYWLMRQGNGLSEPWVLWGTAIGGFLITIVMRIIFARKTCLQFDEDIPFWKIIPFEVSRCWRNLIWRIRYFFSDKYSFICHKV